MLSKTEANLQIWLANPSNYTSPAHPWPLGGKYRGFDYCVVRELLVCNDGTTVSVQQSAQHHCNAGGPDREPSFELWLCPHHPLLEPYGNGDDPYAFVPLSVVVAYIDAHGGMAIEQD